MCSLCRKFYELYPPQESSDGRKWHVVGASQDGFSLKVQAITCAFQLGKFSRDGWNCRTMNVFRELVPSVLREDLTAGSIGILKLPEIEGFERLNGFLVMTWYKNRGSTDSARILRFDHEFELTLEHAEALITVVQDLVPKIIRDALHQGE